MSTEISVAAPKAKSVHCKHSVLISWFMGLASLALAGWIGTQAQARWELGGKAQLGLQALIMSGILVPGIWCLRKFFDRRVPQSIGMGRPIQGAFSFLLGAGFILGPLLLCIASTYAFGWGEVALNWTDGTGQALLLGLATVFFFEALPEELLFRGYIYSHLNTWLERWKSALFTMGLFVLLPLSLVPIQKYLLAMDVDIGGSNAITLSYVIAMILFAAFTQYLRILTGNIWTGIGFHLVFVFINRIMGPDSSTLIQIKGGENEGPMQMVFLGGLLLTFLTLILFPLLTKRKLGWLEKRL